MRVKFIFLLFLLLLSSCATNQEAKPNPQWQYFYDMGMASYMTKNYSEAIAHFFKASQIAPTEPKVWNALGLAYMEAKEYEKAEKALLRALQVDKKYTEAKLNLGIMYYRQGNYEKAINILKEAAEDESYPQRYMAFYYIAKNYQALGNLDEGKRYLSRAVDYYPMFVNAQLELAQIYESEKNYEDAKKIYQNLINNGLDDPNIELSLARIEYELGNYAKAKDHIKRVLGAKQRDPLITSRAYDLLNLVLIAEKTGKIRDHIKEVETSSSNEVRIGEQKEIKVAYRETQMNQKQEDIKEPEPVGHQTEKYQKTQVDKNTTTSSYKIQLGAFSSLDYANSWKSRLENNLNLKDVVIVERSGVYRVLYGNFNNIEDAVRELIKLKNINIYGFIVQE